MAQAMEDTSYRLVKSEVRDLTPELAEEFRNLEPSPTERELNPARIKHLKTKAEAGQLVTFHWSVARLGDKRLRMNGQHSSNMLCGLNGHFPKGLKVHIDEYEVPNKASLALLFRQFDDRKSNRSPSDVASAYQGLYEELHEVPKGPAKMAVEGACWYDRYVEGLPAPTRRRSICSVRRTRPASVHPLGRRTVLGQDPGAAPTDHRRGNVRHLGQERTRGPEVLGRGRAGRRRIRRERTVYRPGCVAQGNGREAGGKNELKPANLYQGCVFAWNAYREGKTIQTIKFDAKKGLYAVHE